MDTEQVQVDTRTPVALEVGKLYLTVIEQRVAIEALLKQLKAERERDVDAAAVAEANAEPST